MTLVLDVRDEAANEAMVTDRLPLSCRASARRASCGRPARALRPGARSECRVSYPPRLVLLRYRTQGNRIASVKHPLAALDAFVEHGYHGAIMRDIASRLGMTMLAIYHHYEDKQELLFTPLKGGLTETLGRMKAAVREAGDDPAAEAARAIQAMCQAVAHWYRPSGEVSPDRIAEYCIELALAMVGANQPAYGRGSTMNARQGGRR